LLDPQEEATLEKIAASVGSTLPIFARAFFRNEGESFLRGVFLAFIADGQISDAEWRHLIDTTSKLGISHRELLDVIGPQARRLVEHVLADAKADGKLSNQERMSLAWLLQNLGLSAEYRRYVEAEIHQLQTLTDIESGRLSPILVPPGVEIRAGEILYYHAPAVWRHVRLLKSGLHHADHSGTLSLTDNRLIFASATKSLTVNYRKIVSHRGGQNWIELQIEGKPADTLYLQQASPIPYALFRTVVAMANQTKVAQVDGASSRHIPRDVRQRVWQAYGGRCADCGAEDYLEFDHIIPVAKGGGNSEANVQLLCWRCNLKKSDRI
jgi:hypothetical protein